MYIMFSRGSKRYVFPGPEAPKTPATTVVEMYKNFANHSFNMYAPFKHSQQHSTRAAQSFLVQLKTLGKELSDLCQDINIYNEVSQDYHLKQARLCRRMRKWTTSQNISHRMPSTSGTDTGWKS